jgi:GT2 family glycosyltransferase
MTTPLWTITILTIPGREEHLRRLLSSITPETASRAVIHLVYNRSIRDDLADVERQLRAWAEGRTVEVYFNNGDPTISGGRNFQLNLVKTPLVCFIDDDLTLEGPVLAALEAALQNRPAALVGLRSYHGDSDDRFKPRDTTPHVAEGDFRWSVVQGMLAAGYTNLLRDAGGFNARRRFWGEWTELNLRLWRLGLPTGYLMTGPFLRHWEDAPDSPTRNLEGRERHVLWGIICTALEYDAVDVTEATATFWRLVEERYLSYSFGEELSPRTVLQHTLALMPEISAAWGEISAFREQTKKHPFPFAPFHAFTRADLDRVLPTAKTTIATHRRGIFPAPRGLVAGIRGWMSRLRVRRRAPSPEE